MAETVEGEVVLTRDRSSGRVHKRIRLAGETILRTFEGCNVDDAGESEVIESTEGIEPSDLCARCFPRRLETDGAPA